MIWNLLTSWKVRQWQFNTKKKGERERKTERVVRSTPKLLHKIIKVSWLKTKLDGKYNKQVKD